MKLTMLLPPKPCDAWHLAAQVGVRHAVIKAAPEQTGLNPPWDIDALRTVVGRMRDAGFTVLGLEGDQFDMSRIKWGLDGLGEDIERYRQMLHNMGELGLGLLCYNFMPRPAGAAHDWHRTQTDVPARGGALATGFDLDAFSCPPDDAPTLGAEVLGANHRYFLDAVLPDAERAGVRMALHPDDPPLPSLGGVARLFHRPEAFDAVYTRRPSGHNAVTFCQANFRLMGTDIATLARDWIGQGRVAFIHIRDVVGTAESFIETFHDAGPTDLGEMLCVYHDSGFTGPIRLDHTPLLYGEDRPDMPGYGILGRLHAVGYLRGLAEARGVPLD